METGSGKGWNWSGIFVYDLVDPKSYLFVIMSLTGTLKVKLVPLKKEEEVENQSSLSG